MRKESGQPHKWPDSIPVLKLESRPKLDMARRVHCRGDLAKGAAVDAGIRIGEPRRVSEIEKLAADLQLHAFVNFELLAEGEICIMDAVRSRCGDIAGRVPRDLVAREAEA